MDHHVRPASGERPSQGCRIGDVGDEVLERSAGMFDVSDQLVVFSLWRCARHDDKIRLIATGEGPAHQRSRRAKTSDDEVGSLFEEQIAVASERFHQPAGEPLRLFIASNGHLAAIGEEEPLEDRTFMPLVETQRVVVPDDRPAMVGIFEPG